MATKKIPKINFAELKKRCPPNQMKQFNQFYDKHTEYQRRVNKYPITLPRLDWDYYRTNVRTEYVAMVDDFEKKYKELNQIFDSRFEIDTSKYYEDIEKERTVMEKNYNDFVRESNERIKQYEAEMLRIRSLKPYEEMTMEEYCDIKRSPFYTAEGVPSFWPHMPDEQTPGPMGVPVQHEEDKEALKKKPLLTKELMEQHAESVKAREAAEGDQLMGDAKTKEKKAEPKADSQKEAHDDKKNEDDKKK